MPLTTWHLPLCCHIRNTLIKKNKFIYLAMRPNETCLANLRKKSSFLKKKKRKKGREGDFYFFIEQETFIRSNIFLLLLYIIYKCIELYKFSIHVFHDLYNSSFCTKTKTLFNSTNFKSSDEYRI